MRKFLYGLLICSLLATGFFYITGSQESTGSCPKHKVAGGKEFHSQFFEDYILSIVFADTKKGAYIDVGANSPDEHSVTKYFYLRGWRGINIEPMKQWYEQLVQARPEDINLNVGISSKAGTLEFYTILYKGEEKDELKNLTGLSTFDKASLKKAVERGFTYKTSTIPVITLNEVMERHPMSTITFVKIDVEGKEKDVLSGFDLSKHRPQVFIIEATEPGTVIRSDHVWKDILLNNGYDFAMFDGLNAYYVAKEHSKLLAGKFEKAYGCAKSVNDELKVFPNEMDFNKDLF